MADVLESASAIMRSSERRVEVVSNNVANVSTPGFRRQVSFVDVTASLGAGGANLPVISTRLDESSGKLESSGHSLDLAISGEGFFQLQAGEATLYSRNGQFRRLEDGRVANAQGHILQQADGGDLVLDSAAVEILADGTVIDGERPVARIALFLPESDGAVQSVSGSSFSIDGAVREVEEPQLRQGMVEGSNVVLGDEMVTMMAALRQAESGARLATLYDELMGRAITTLGQAR
jgi:flagellar basal-body rod protein FlgG